VMGLYSARARDLQSILGRPLQNDPLGYGAGDVNTYRWEGNNPASVTDPSGMFWVPPPNQTVGWTEADYRFRDAFERARLPRWDEGSWFREEKFVNIEDDREFRIYGGEGSGGLTRQEAFDQAKKEIGEFVDHLKTEAALAIVTAIATPVVAAGVARLIDAGWKVIKVGGKYFLKKGNRHIEVPRQHSKFDQCFPAGTQVHTSQGLKYIEQIVAGDRVWAYCHRRLEWEEQEVFETYRTQHSGTMVTLQIKGETLRATGGHPFWVVRGDALVVSIWRAPRRPVGTR
jgi:hypothetical protein